MSIASTVPASSAGDSAALPGGPTFHDLGLAPHLVKALDAAGFENPFPIQAMCIPDAVAGRDVSGKARTGSGKTLAYGLPLLQRTSPARKRRPRSLILVPTRELALQVVAELRPFARVAELRLAAIYGGASLIRQVKELHSGVDLVVATPGRLNDLLERKEMSVSDVESVVIDEADQMADMGFMPQVRAILNQASNDHQTLLFSATLDGSIGTFVREYQHDPVTHEAPGAEVSIETLDQRFIGVGNASRVRVAAEICSAVERSIIFVRTRHGADRLAKQLGNEGLEAAPIHGGLNQRQRERTLGAFSRGRVRALVATNVAARGIHIDDVNTVLHFDLPEDGKTYLHRSGRTARAGADGLVVTLVMPGEERDVRDLQREAGVHLSTVPMEPGDERLTDLRAWAPPAPSPAPKGGGRKPDFAENRSGGRAGAPAHRRKRQAPRHPGSGKQR